MIDTFLDACSRWLSDEYFCDLRYIAESRDERYDLLAAAILLNPLPPPQESNLSIELPKLIAGQEQAGPIAKAQLLSLVRNATRGGLSVHGKQMTLEPDGALRVQSSATQRDAWFSPLSIQIIGCEPRGVIERLAMVDHALRSTATPFDGLADLTNSLALPTPQTGHLSTLTITVNPPVDLILDRCQLSNDQLHLTLHAHPTCDLSQVLLAIRAVPGGGLAGRLQIAEKIRWGEVSDGRREGTVIASCPNSDGVLAMLMIGAETVRRNWFVDQAKAANPRLVAVQQFDKDLRMIKQGLFDASESARFENAVAALLFLFGFSPAVQLETDAPDLIVATPGGKLAVVECTTRIADVAAKIGKLVDRRGALTKALQASGHPVDVTAAVVCRLPRDQIAAHSSLFRSSRVVLVAAEELNNALLRARFHQNPDELFSEASRTLATETPWSS